MTEKELNRIKAECHDHGWRWGLVVGQLMVASN